MTERSVTHATFTIERAYDASAARVFAAWADPAAKARWFAGPDEWGPAQYEIDFQVGGREVSRNGPNGGSVYAYDARYQEIVPDERIIYTYEMYLDGTRISVSLATVEFKPAGAGTRLIYTEQGAFLDGLDSPDQRQQGSGALFDALDAELRRLSATT